MSVTRKGIPPETLQQIRDHIDLVDVISRYVTLTKTGQNYKGLCPFHSEKSPSFSVSPSRQMFHCFGCGVGGDAFTFLMKREGLGFTEAVQEMAKLAGIRLEFHAREGSFDKNSSDRERYHDLHTKAAEWFHDRLLNSEAGKQARQYLEDRGMSHETISKFGVGYAPSSWNGLLFHFEKAGIKPQELFQSGLIIKKDQSTPAVPQGYDRFRDRVMFPIADARGHVIAFGGRALSDEQMPKYLNSPETPWFSKSRTLYGFDKTREAASRVGRLILVEGYFDVLALYQTGVQHVAAPLGTALTAEHIQTIRRLVKSVLLFFDGDAAGIRAALRTLDLFMNTGLTVKVITLPPGDDPDTYIRTQGIAAFQELEAKACSLLDFAIQQSLKDHKSASIEERVSSVDNILRLLQKTKNPIEREERIQLVSERLGIREETLLKRYPMLQSKPNRSFERPSQPDVHPVSPSVLPKGRPEERDVIVLALQGRLKAQQLQQLRAEMFTVPEYRRTMQFVLEHVDAEGCLNVDSMQAEALEDSQCGAIVTHLMLADAHFDDQAAYFQECLSTIERKHIQHLLNERIAELKVAEQERKSEDIQRLVIEINELRGQKATLIGTSSGSGET